MMKTLIMKMCNYASQSHKAFCTIWQSNENKNIIYRMVALNLAKKLEMAK